MFRFFMCLKNVLEDMRADIASIVSSLIVGELVVNSENYKGSRLQTTRKACAMLAKDLGMSRADLPENLRVKLDSFSKADNAAADRLDEPLGRL